MTEALLDVISESPQQTLDIACRLGRQLKPGDVVALHGQLGSGKTWFVKGLARAVGVSDSRQVKSPSFVLINVYEGDFTIYHIDAYRLSTPEEFEDLGSWEFLHAPDKLVVVEWAEKVAPALTEPYIEVTLEHRSPTRRRIEIRWAGVPDRAIRF